MGEFLTRKRGGDGLPDHREKTFWGWRWARNIPPGHMYSRASTCPQAHTKLHAKISAQKWTLFRWFSPPPSRQRLRPCSRNTRASLVRPRTHGALPHAPMIPRCSDGRKALHRFSTWASLKLLTASSPKFYSLILFFSIPIPVVKCCTVRRVYAHLCTCPAGLCAEDPDPTESGISDS